MFAGWKRLVRTGACLFCSLALAAPVVAADFEAQKAARKELASMGMLFTESQFAAAVKRGDILSVELYLKGGMDPDLVIDRGLSHSKTAITYAAEQNNPGLVKILLEGGASTKQVLTQAAGRNDLNLVLCYLDNLIDRIKGIILQDWFSSSLGGCDESCRLRHGVG